MFRPDDQPWSVGAINGYHFHTVASTRSCGVQQCARTTGRLGSSLQVQSHIPPYEYNGNLGARVRGPTPNIKDPLPWYLANDDAAPR